MTFNNILAHFTVKERKALTARCVCPVHGDNNDFLLIKQKQDGGVELYDMGDCDNKDILKAAGLTELDLLADVDRLAKKLEGLQAYMNEKYPANDKGFSRVFAKIFEKEIRYNPDIKDFMTYDGKRWVKDTEGMIAKGKAKDLSTAFLKYYTDAKITDQAYLKAISGLESYNKRNIILKDAQNETAMHNDDLDKDDYTLNVQNGTLDLSGEPVLKPHNADDMLSKVANASYRKDADCPLWLKTLDTILQGDEGKIKYLQKLFGISLTGSTAEEKMFILYGESTRNGKSTVIETILYLLGDYGLTIRPESLAMKNNADSKAANGDIARLKDARLVNCPEPKKGMLLDCGLVKTLTGRDSITARNLYEREFTFKPKFKLTMNTNYLPMVTDRTVFSSRRISVTAFNKHFGEGEEDLALKDKLLEELPGILNWCIAGLMLYRKEGLIPPDSVKAAIEDYDRNSDKIGLFISECLEETPKTNLKLGDVFTAYAEWCKKNNYGLEGKRNFIADIKQRGIYKEIGTVKGKTFHNVIVGYDMKSDFIDISKDCDIPFK